MFESGLESLISNVNIRIKDGTNSDPNYYDLKYNY